MAKNKWGYERVILNSKAREVMFGAMGRLKTQAKLAGVMVSGISIGTNLSESGVVSYELNFYDHLRRQTLTALDLDEFETKFIEYLLNTKK